MRTQEAAQIAANATHEDQTQLEKTRLERQQYEKNMNAKDAEVQQLRAALAAANLAAATTVPAGSGESAANLVLAEVDSKMEAMKLLVSEQKEDFMRMITTQQNQQLDIAKQQQTFNEQMQDQQLKFQQSTQLRFQQLNEQIMVSRETSSTSPTMDFGRITECMGEAFAAALKARKTKLRF